MMRKMYYADNVTQAISMQNVILKYTSMEPKKGRIQCPFHDGENFNLSFNKEVFQCFVCGEKGNIFTFVMKLFGIDYFQAVEKIKYDFGLSAPIGVQGLRQKRRSQYQALVQIKTEHADTTEKQKKYTEIDKLQQLWDCYERCLDVFKPQSPEEPLHPLFIEALQNKEYYGYLLDIAESGGTNIERNNDS